MTPEEYRRRYFELKRAAQEAATQRPVGRLPQNPALIPPHLPRHA